MDAVAGELDSPEGSERTGEAVRVSEAAQHGAAGAVLTVDRDGRVVRVAAWPWSSPPLPGAPFGAAFDAESGAQLDRLIARRWIGAGEVRFALRSGRAVALSVAELADGFQLAVHDVTAAAVVDQATEQRRRMRVVSQLAGTLARELTDPMSIVQGRLELLLDVGLVDPASIQRHLTIALEHSRRVTATLRNLRLVGHLGAAPDEPVPFAAVLRETLDLLGPRADRVLAHVEPTDLAVGCEAALPARVCASLARQAMEGVGRGSIHLWARRVRSLVQVRIGPSGRVSSDPPTEADELALDRTLLASVGGALVARRVGSAPSFEFTLPAAPSQRSRRRPVRGRILIVGPTLGEAVPLMLQRDGYAFEAVGTADAALASLELHPCEVVISELLLDGGASGLSLAQVVTARFPDTRMLVVAEGGDLPILPLPVVALSWPTSRASLLAALGNRVRH